MNRSSQLWVKTLLAGTLVFSAVPAISFSSNTAYAATSQITVNSTSDIVDQLYKGLMNRDAQVTFTYKGSTAKLKSMLQDSFETALEKDPYTMYILDSYGLTWRSNAYSALVTVDMKYRETVTQTKYVNDKVVQTVAQIITPGMNDHQKVKAIHDWVVRHLKYDETYTRYTAYEALYDGTAVCQGYALLSYALLKQAGVENKIVEGTAGGELHAWNLVNIDGNWYHMDTTWDDPLPDQGDGVDTNYYLRTDAQMKQDHNWTKTYPAATVAYKDTLNTLIASGGDTSGFYKQLEQNLNYAVDNSPAAVNSAVDLKEQVKNAKASGQSSLVFRYNGNITSLKSDLSRLSAVGIKSISYTVQSLGSSNDLKVNLSWK
ncbi:transglutaminase domain-containing protein [Paenibacillus sp. CFBP13512]|uniref:transglutaminase domain-containing protein n=1 Tax=Paenibacillus sp. CFBP13512 TaxID=2184007 RepID=UPI001375AFEB|nr:transglutaminase domain-containing protein [Paenibacillus sp. CFBP13512]